MVKFAGLDRLKDCEQPILDLLRSEGLAEMRMLDLGVGGGRTTIHFAPHAREYHGIDSSAALVEACRRRFAHEGWPHITWTVADARDLPYESGFFDFVMFSWNGLDLVGDEHDRMRALLEIRRVLAPGRRFFFAAHNLENALARPKSGRAIVRSVLNPQLLWGRGARHGDALRRTTKGVAQLLHPPCGTARAAPRCRVLASRSHSCLTG